MKKYLFIVLLVGVCFGQDAYPYFSDMAKQLEFEKKRIVIEEGESTKQIISGGGSEFNPWSLLTISPNLKLPYLRDALPAYKNIPIKTDYKYHSYFNIKIDGREISEIEMLKLMGLRDEVDRTIAIYKNEVNNYELHLSNYDSSLKTYDELLIKYNNDTSNQIPGSIFFLGFVLAIDGFSNQNMFTSIFGSVVAGYILVSGGFDKSTNMPKKPVPPKIKKPVLKQQLSTAQTKSMVESYNRKLYSDIAKK